MNLSEKMQKIVADNHLLKHPFYQAWMRGELSIGDLQDYAVQYRPHVDAFPQFVALAYGQAPTEEAQKSLLRNLQEEVGNEKMAAHPVLWADFASGLGLNKEEFSSASVRKAGTDLKEHFVSECKSSYASALGCLYAYESQVPEIAEQKISGLKKNYGIDDAATLSFFTVHQEADKHHSAEIAAMIDALPGDQAEVAANACEAATRSLWNFLDEVYDKSEAKTRAATCSSADACVM